jgi:5-methylcytosine-specific restriction endonuclease McrA
MRKPPRLHTTPQAARREARAASDRARAADPDRRFLQSRVWRERIRPQWLDANPYCEWCRLLGKVVAAEQIDHIVRPRGDAQLQRDPSNFRSLCYSHHLDKSNRERRGDERPLRIGCGPDGWPVTVDPVAPGRGMECPGGMA